MIHDISRKNKWILECIDNYIKHGVAKSDATDMAKADALKEEVLHGSVVDIWEPADSIVTIRMQQWSQCV